MARLVAPALEALLFKLIDYAGAFPPASLTVEQAFRNYEEYRRGPHKWMLGRFVISAADIDRLPAEIETPLAVLANEDNPRAESIESKSAVHSSKPVYWECGVMDLERVQEAGNFAKFRTGGVTPEAIPSVDTVAEFVLECGMRGVAFKATAGLHHPIRSLRSLTYAADSPRAMMHGFLNLFLAAAFAWSGKREINRLLAETDPSAFRFDDDQARWRDWSLSAEQIVAARREFAHSFGSCSFTEPVEDLEMLGWL